MKFALLILLFPLSSSALVLKEATLKSKAYFINTPGGVFEALDLRSKTFSFNSADFESCADHIVRKPHSLKYSCTLTLNSRNEQSKLQLQASQPLVRVSFGAIQKNVKIEVSKDARFVTFSTALDDTGLDYNVANFNDELFKVQDKVAQLIISEAMTVQNLEIHVLESAHPDLPKTIRRASRIQFN